MRLSWLRCLKATSLMRTNNMEDTLRGLLTRTPSLIPKASVLPARNAKGELVLLYHCSDENGYLACL